MNTRRILGISYTPLVHPILTKDTIEFQITNMGLSTYLTIHVNKVMNFVER